MYDIQAEIHPHKYKQHENHEYMGKDANLLSKYFFFSLVCENVFDMTIQVQQKNTSTIETTTTYLCYIYI